MGKTDRDPTTEHKSSNAVFGSSYSGSSTASLPTSDTACNAAATDANNHEILTLRAFCQDYAIDREVLVKSRYLAKLIAQHEDENHVVAPGTIFELTFDDAEKVVTSLAFEVAIAYLYGTCLEDIRGIDLDVLYGLLIVAGLLELPELFDDTVALIKASISQVNVANIVRYCVNHNYGEVTQDILGAASQFLCDQGTDMPIDALLRVPSDVLVGALSNDAFYAETEFERTRLVLRLYETTKSGKLKQRLANLLNTRIYYCHMPREQVDRLRHTAKHVIHDVTFDRHDAYRKQMQDLVSQAKKEDRRLNKDVSGASRRSPSGEHPALSSIPPLRLGASIILDHLVELGDRDYFLAGNRMTPCLMLTKDEAVPDELILQMCILRRSTQVPGCFYEYEDPRDKIAVKVSLHTQDFNAEREVELSIWEGCRGVSDSSNSSNERVNIAELKHRPIRAAFALFLL